jgi:hypothetical protein
MRQRHPDMLAELCRELDALARSEEDEAAAQAAEVPYWLPVPSSVAAHRGAAQSLHDIARRLEAEARAWQFAT